MAEKTDKKNDKPKEYLNLMDQEKMKKAVGALSTQDKLALARASTMKKIGEDMAALVKKSEKFKTSALKKFKKDIVGILAIPPRPAQQVPGDPPQKESTDPEVIVVLEFKENLNMIEKQKRFLEIEDVLLSDGEKHLKGTKIFPVTVEQIWDMCYKGRYEILQLLTIGQPIYDTGWLGAIKLVETHKMMVLRKFEKYVVSYVLAGSIVRGEADHHSDVDTFIVIDDTDVTKMTSIELRQKLMAIAWQYAAQAGEETGIRNKLNVQVYVLTDMWDTIKNAHPVIFSFLREGVPLYDRGMFTPWKLLLKHGKISPSPEAIDTYMKTGRKQLERVKLRLRDIGVDDFFWMINLPIHGALMLLGHPPPVPHKMAEKMREHLVKPGLLEEKYVKIWDSILQLRKDIEHGTIKEVDPTVIAEKMKQCEDFLNRIDKLYEAINKTGINEGIEELSERAREDIMIALKLVGIKATKKNALKMFKQEVIDKQLAPTRYYDLLETIFKLAETKDTDRAEISRLTFEQDQFSKQTLHIIETSKGEKTDKYKLSVRYESGAKTATFWLFSKEAYLLYDNSEGGTTIRKYKINDKGSLTSPQASTLRDVEKKLVTYEGTPTTLTKLTIDSLKQILGDDIKIIIGA